VWRQFAHSLLMLTTMTVILTGPVPRASATPESTQSDSGVRCAAPANGPPTADTVPDQHPARPTPVTAGDVVTVRLVAPYPAPPIRGENYPAAPIAGHGYPAPPIAGHGYPAPPIRGDGRRRTDRATAGPTAGRRAGPTAGPTAGRRAGPTVGPTGGARTGERCDRPGRRGSRFFGVGHRAGVVTIVVLAGRGSSDTHCGTGLHVCRADPHPGHPAPNGFGVGALADQHPGLHRIGCFRGPTSLRSSSAACGFRRPQLPIRRAP
jgi:hypothetical protein